ncbi:MAG: DUF502 domain-containing protein [Chloroflexi bacterium]|nr:DUF502 domain-containing protein [Chloroflexota bacterium]
MGQPASRRVWSPFLRHLRRSLTAGLLLLVPVGITYWVLSFTFRFLDGLFDPLAQRVLGKTIPGLGILLLLLLVYLAGLVASNFVGRAIIRAGQGALLRIPLVNTIYNASKQLIESFSGEARQGFKRVVLIEYPRQGVWTLGFLTGTTSDETGMVLGIIYIPTTPTPTSGAMVILPMTDIHDTDLTVQQALGIVFSGGITSPPQIRKVPAA